MTTPHLVYDSLYGPVRQVRSQNLKTYRAEPKSRITTTYHTCKLQPTGVGSAFTTQSACEESNVCVGSGKAYSYKCDTATKGLIKIPDGTGTNFDATNCWGCQQGANVVTSGGSLTGVCTFQPQSNASNFYSEALCKSNPTAQCGWQYGCES